MLVSLLLLGPILYLYLVEPLIPLMTFFERVTPLAFRPSKGNSFIVSVNMNLTTWEFVGLVILVILLFVALALAIWALVRSGKSVNQPFVHREDDTVQTAADSTATVILFGIAKHRRDFCYAADTGTFTAKCGGYYNINANLAISPAPDPGAPVQMYILVNGTSIYGTTQQEGEGGFLAINLDTNVRLCAKDTFQVILISQGAGSVDVTPTDDAPTRLIAGRLAEL